MYDGRVGGNDKIEIFHNGGRIDESIGAAIKVITRSLNVHAGGALLDLLNTIIFLQANEPDTFYLA